MALHDGFYEQSLAAAKRWYLYFIMAGIILSLIIIYLTWQNHQMVTVTLLSQEQVRMPAGVQLVADNALIPLTKPQVQEVTMKIVQAEARPPDQVVTVAGKDMEKTVENVRKQRQTLQSLPIPKNHRKNAVKPNEPVNLNVYY